MGCHEWCGWLDHRVRAWTADESWLRNDCSRADPLDWWEDNRDAIWRTTWLLLTRSRSVWIWTTEWLVRKAWGSRSGCNWSGSFWHDGIVVLWRRSSSAEATSTWNIVILPLVTRQSRRPHACWVWDRNIAGKIAVVTISSIIEEQWLQCSWSARRVHVFGSDERGPGALWITISTGGLVDNANGRRNTPCIPWPSA